MLPSSILNRQPWEKWSRVDSHRREKRIIYRQQNNPVSCVSNFSLLLLPHSWQTNLTALVGGSSMDASIKGASDIKSKLR